MAERTVKGTLEWDVSDLISSNDAAVRALRDAADEADRLERGLEDGFDGATQASGRFVDAVNRINLDDLDVDIDTDGLRRIAADLDEVEQSGSEAADAIGRDVEQAMGRASQASGEFTADVEDDVDRQKRSWTELGGAVDDYTGDLKQVGSLVGAAGLGAVTVELDSQAGAAGRLQAQLGLTADEAENVGDVARDVFVNNFGDSIADAGDTVALLAGSVRDLTDDELQAMAEGVLATEDAFGHLGADADILVEDLRTLTANFPGLDEADALDLVVDAFQRGTGNAGDLQDTLQEYPGDFSALGLSAEDMFGILEAGFANGVRNTDLVADGIREMGILVQEEGGKAEEALSRIFGEEEAARLQAAFAEGGEAGREAFFQIAAGLAAVEDPQQQFNDGVDIMGTKFEDSRAQMPELLDALAGLEDGTVDAAGATEKLNAQYDTASSRIETVKRRLSTGVIGAIGDAGGVAVEAATGIGTLALGLQGLGIDLGTVKGKIRGFKWGELSKGKAIGLSLGAAAVGMEAIVRTTNALNDRDQDLDGLAAGIQSVADSGSSQQLEAAVGGVDGLERSIADLYATDSSFGGRARLAFQIQLEQFTGGRFASDIDQSSDALSAMTDTIADFLSAGDLDTASAGMGALAEAAEGAGVPLDYIVDLSPALQDALANAGVSAEELAGYASGAGDSIGGAGESAETASGQVSGLAGYMNDVKTKFAEAAAEGRTTDEVLADLEARFRGLTGGARDVRAATADWEASVDDLAEAVMEETGELDANGEAITRRNTTLDLSTEKGRENEAAIQASQQAAEDHAVAVLEETGSIEQANAVLDQHRVDLEEAMIQAGFSEEAAREYSAEIARIPEDAKTQAEFNDAQARQDAQSWDGRIAAITDRIATHASFTGDWDDLNAYIGGLERARTLSRAPRFEAARNPRGDGPGYAEGTDWHPGGPAYVNDADTQIRGELIHLPTGAAVTPSGESVKMMAEAFRQAGGPNAGPTVNQKIYGEVTPRTAFRARDAWVAANGHS